MLPLLLSLSKLTCSSTARNSVGCQEDAHRTANAARRPPSTERAAPEPKRALTNARHDGKLIIYLML